MQMLDSRGDTQSGVNTYAEQTPASSYQEPSNSYSNPQVQSQPQTSSPSIPEIDIDDDEIPF